jgi:hypothetical protein
MDGPSPTQQGENAIGFVSAVRHLHDVEPAVVRTRDIRFRPETDTGELTIADPRLAMQEGIGPLRPSVAHRGKVVGIGSASTIMSSRHQSMLSKNCSRSPKSAPRPVRVGLSEVISADAACKSLG